jgi:hypothetical protein
MKSKSESGLAHVVLLILVLLVIGVIVFVGMRVVEDQNTGETTGSAPPTLHQARLKMPQI